MLVQATYWHNPLKEDKYREASTFIAEINNENVINQTYVDNLKKLNKYIDNGTMNPMKWFFFDNKNNYLHI